MKNSTAFLVGIVLCVVGGVFLWTFPDYFYPPLLVFPASFVLVGFAIVIASIHGSMTEIEKLKEANIEKPEKTNDESAE